MHLGAHITTCLPEVTVVPGRQALGKHYSTQPVALQPLERLWWVDASAVLWDWRA